MAPYEIVDAQLPTNALQNMQFDDTCSDPAPVEQFETSDPELNDEPQPCQST